MSEGGGRWMTLSRRVRKVHVTNDKGGGGAECEAGALLLTLGPGQSHVRDGLENILGKKRILL